MDAEKARGSGTLSRYIRRTAAFSFLMKGKTVKTICASLSGLLAITVVFLTGCSTFQSSKRMDMSPFAENTGTLYVEAAKIARPFRFTTLKPYLNIPEAETLRSRSYPVMSALRGVVMYSNQLVALNNANLSEKERNNQLAKYLDEIINRVAEKRALDSLGLSRGDIDAILSKVRAADTYLDGIAAAEPLVHSVVLAMGSRLEELRSMIPLVTGAIDRQVEMEYAPTRSNLKALTDLRYKSMKAAALLFEGRMGNRQALDTLLQIDESVRELMPSPREANAKTMQAAEAHLAERLARIDVYIHQLDPEVADYKTKQQELEDFRLNVDERIKIARSAMTIWSQSHRNLGAGIPVPPLIDIAGMAAGLARTAVPIP
jgi:hypothetical protein